MKKCEHNTGSTIEITLKDTEGEILAPVGYWCGNCGAFYFADESDWRLPLMIRSKTAN